MTGLPQVGLVQCAEDPQFLGVTLYPTQRSILAELDEGNVREAILCLGRRSGKSLLSAIVAVHDACFRDLRAFQRDGERRHILIVAVNREQARLTLGYVRELLAGSPLLAETVVGDTMDSISVRQPATGQLVTVRSVPCNSKSVRGTSTATLVADEMAFWLGDGTDGPAIASEVYRALKPSIAQFKEAGRVICLSTPWGKSEANLFYRLFLQASSGDHPDMKAWQLPTWRVNPEIPAAWLEAERQKDETLWRGEFGAEFLDSGRAYLPHERIMAAVTDDRFELPPDQIGPDAVGALDPAFAADPFAFSILDRDPERRERLRVVLVRSWQPSGDGELGVVPVLDEIAGLCKAYGVRTALTDQYCSAPVRQLLAKRGVHVREHTMSVSSKTSIYAALKSKLLAGDLELYRDKILLDELGRLEAHFSPGSSSVRIPRVGSSHGDRAQSVALAVHELARVPASNGEFRSGGGLAGVGAEPEPSRRRRRRWRPPSDLERAAS